MDRWESSIEDYQRSQTLDSFISVLRTAESILKEDLAAFEFDWFIQTLLAEPVLLLDTVSVRLSDAAWSKAVKDAYKLLSDLVENHYDEVEMYIENIVTECQKPQEPRTRSHAIQCLTTCAKRIMTSELAIRYIGELGTASTCRAQLALLVGTICEHHPELVTEHIDTIWRTYLKMLGSNKNTDLVCKSLLKGVWGLFKNFGTEISVRELTEFYNQLTRDHLSKCETAVLPILRDYASLFKEKLASDAPLRRELWTFDDLSAILPVYGEIGKILNNDQLQKILNTEIAPKIRENYPKLRFTALRVCVLFRGCGVLLEGLLNVDVYSLEFELRNEVSYEVSEAVHWSIESNMINCEKLLQTCIMFYDNIPATRRKLIVVNGLLNAPEDMMSTTLNFLINETCQDEHSLASYLPIWRDIFDSQLMDKKGMIFKMYIENLLVVIENFLEDSCEKKIPSKLAILIHLTSHVLTFHTDGGDQCRLVSSQMVHLSRECGLDAGIVAVARSMIPHLGDENGIRKIYKMIQIDNCKDEALLCESCLALIQEPDMTESNIVLKALEVIFSRKDAEPKTLSMGINKMEKLIVKNNNNLDKNKVTKIIQLIQKLRSRKDMYGKDARILQRDITVFLGKYFNSDELNECDHLDDALMVKLKDVLTLDVPNPVEGTTYKIKMSRLLQLAIINEDEDSLRMLVNIICANLLTNASPLLHVALGRVMVSLCRATVGATRQNVARHAASFCNVDTTLYIIQQITQEKSPAVRRMLSETIEGILLREPGSEDNEVLLKAVFKEVCAMLGSPHTVLKLGGLDITDSLLSSLKVNSRQTKEMLAPLLQLICKTNEEEAFAVFENASNLFIENISLFSDDVLDITITGLLKTLVSAEYEITNNAKAKIHKDNLKTTLMFLKRVFDKEGSCIMRKVFEIQTEGDSVKFVYLWSEIPKHFDVKVDYIEGFMCLENSFVLERVFDEDVASPFALEAHLRFINVYADVLFKSYCSQTVNHISGIIKKLTAKSVRMNRLHLTECIKNCKRILHRTPDMILKSLEIWSESIPLKDITEYIEKEKFINEHAVLVNALNVTLDAFRLNDPTFILTTVGVFAKTWSRIILKLYASGKMRYLTKEVPYLSDLLSVSLSFLTVTDIKSIVQEGRGLSAANVGIEFTRFFMPVFAKYLVRKPYLMMQEGLEDTWVLLNDVVKWCVRKRWRDERLERVLDLVDMMWPSYEPKAAFKSKHSLLLDLSCLSLKLDAESSPMRWARALLSSTETSRDDKIALVGVLPGGEEYSEAYRSYAASLLPTRFSDMDGTSRTALRALLDALAGMADPTLLEIVITLADGDDASGWWDEALSSCMGSLARLPTLTLELLETVFRNTRSPSVCSRLLVPLLRSTPSVICEKFFASILKDTLQGLSVGVKPPSLHPEYKTCVQQKTIALDVLQVVFEKVPASKIESPSSCLYENIQTDKTWHLAREVIRLCYRLRDKLVTPEGASRALARVCRAFQHTAYQCMCICVCVRKPDENIYGTVFSGDVWARIVDEDAVYDLPLKTEWNKYKMHRTVSIAVKDVARQSRSSSRTRIFLRTLSENPLDYDFIQHQDDDMDSQEVLLTDNSLNKHPCAATLAALFEHASTLTHYKWREALCEALTTSGRNVKWLLAETVCNCEDVMKAHATALRPALLAVVSDTKQEGLNSLHIDILNTLIHWDEDPQLPPEAVSALNVAVDALVDTALKNCTRKTIFKMLEDTLEGILKIYGCYLNGALTGIEQSLDDSNRTKSCLKILLRFANNNIRVPSLLALLMRKMEENFRVYREEMSLLAELVGVEIAKSNVIQRSNAVNKLKTILEKVKKNNISDYVKILQYTKCCDEQQFRIIVDTTQKLPEADRRKCLRIISAYISEHPDSPETAEVPPDIRQMADRMSGDRHFDELFKDTAHFPTPPSPKRARVVAASPILNTVAASEKSVSEALSRLGKERVGRVCEKLCKTDMTVRFVECFYLAIYLPVMYPCDKYDLSVCLSSFLEMLFSHLKTLTGFKDRKLREEPWVAEHPIGLTIPRTKRMIGTLRSFSYSINDRYFDDDKDSKIDLQTTIETVLDKLMQFAKVTPDAAMELIAQLLRCLGRGFESRNVLAQLLSKLLPTAPELVVLARECVDQLYSIDGFIQTVYELKKSTVGTEGEQLFRILYEDILLRFGGPEIFILGTSSKEENILITDDKEFSIQELASAFQKLSNWEEIPLQEKRGLEAGLPVLWTDRDRFKQLLFEYADKDGWFGKMVQLHRDERKDVMKWLRCLGRWPQRQYVNSSIMEAMQWHSVDHSTFDIDSLQFPCVIQKSDCLVEWAARLMLRCAYLTDKSDSESIKRLSRSHELLWCESANERGLHHSALSVIKRNCLEELEEDETLKWMEQKMLATIGTGLKWNDSSVLEKVLDITTFLPDYYKHSTPDAIIGVNALTMKLYYNLKSLSTSKIDEINIIVEEEIKKNNKRNVTSEKNKKNLTELYGTAVLYYDGMDDNELNNDDILIILCEYLGKFIEAGLDGASVAAIILNRLDHCEAISEKLAATLLAKFKPIISKLPSCYLEQLKAKLTLIPNYIVRSSGIAELQGDPNLDKYKQCFQLLCHADYLLLQYCEELYAALQSGDTSKWEKIYKRMKSRVFENEFAGTDYQALRTYQGPISALQNADPSTKRIVLNGIIQELRSKQPRETVRLSHVCPTLGGEQGGLGKLLKLPPGVEVLRIEEELRVFIDSVRRPCVVSMLTTDGRVLRYLFKNEDLRADAAVNDLHLAGGKGYDVIPLGDDCGLIQFLEDHKRIRDLIASTCSIDGEMERQAVKDDELILAPKLSSVQNFNRLCEKIPAYALRSAIENHSASVQDFITKKRNFTNTLSDITVINWLFGLGDRHLQNLLYSVQDGGVQCIDWGAIFQYGASELPPARLTRNMLAVCDTAVLESMVQALLSNLRNSRHFIVPVLKISFRWMDDFTEKLVYMNGILQGRMVAHVITKDVILKSNKAHKLKYIELLEKVFVEHTEKDVYTVEEQVSSLLMQCTDPWILSVTRSGWEPWL